MTDHLADELRGILDDLHDAEYGSVPKALVRERLLRLVEHVEQVGEPDGQVLDVAGLDTDQEIRARALDVAAYVIGDVSGTVAGVAQHLVDLAEPLVDWIRAGQRPS